MKILIISYYFPPLNAIASHRPYSWAKYWALMGHDITVLTGKKEDSAYNLEAINTGYKIIEVENKVDHDLAQIKLTPDKVKTNLDSYQKTLAFKTKKAIKDYFHKTGIVTWDARMPNRHDFSIVDMIKKVNQQDWDLVVSTFAPYACHLAAYHLKKQNKTKYWIADYRDLWTESHLFKGLFPFNYFEEYLERKINQKADILTTVSKPLVDRLKEKYNKHNVFVIENGFDIDNLKNLPIENYWQDCKIRLVYTGSIYPGNQDPSPLFKAIKRISQSSQSNLLDNLEVIFVGGIKANLDQLIKKFELANYVRHAGQISRTDALWLQRDADVLIFLEFNSPTNQGILTGKIFEYLFSGTEIWGIGTTMHSISGKLIHESNSGECFGTDETRIEKELVTLLKSGKKPVRKRNSEILQQYTREKLAKKLLNLTNKVLNNSPKQNKSSSTNENNSI